MFSNNFLYFCYKLRYAAECIFGLVELQSTRKDFEQFKKQAEGVSKEYDRLLAEHGKLQVTILTNYKSKTTRHELHYFHVIEGYL